jgi:hypothetical protein
VVAVEGAGVLGQRVEQPAEGRPRLAVQRVGVGGSDDIGPGRVHCPMDAERRSVDLPLALDDVALLVHHDEVADLDQAEVHAQWVHPEAVDVLGVTGGDVARHTLVEPHLGEEPERGGELLLAIQPLLVDVVRLR